MLRGVHQIDDSSLGKLRSDEDSSHAGSHEIIPDLGRKGGDSDAVDGGVGGEVPGLEDVLVTDMVEEAVANDHLGALLTGAGVVDGDVGEAEHVDGGSVVGVVGAVGSDP